MMPRRFLVRLLPLLLLVLLCAPARAQLGSLLQSTTNTPPASRNEPVTFAADQVEYDRENALVIARGLSHRLAARLVVGAFAVAAHPAAARPDGARVRRHQRGVRRLVLARR